MTAQSEYSTDILFKSRQDLCELYPKLLSHSTLCFGAREVTTFLGRKLNGNFQGEIVSDLSSLVCRRMGGSRTKHRVKENWAHGMIAKIARTRRWRVTLYGRRVMGSALCLRDYDFHVAYSTLGA